MITWLNCFLITTGSEESPALQFRETGPKESALLEAISGGLSDAEGLSGKTGLSAAETVSVLSRMEVEGLVARGPGGRYYLLATRR